MALSDPGSWEYRGEGAANVVLAYQGLESDLTGKVLRIRKVVRSTPGADGSKTGGGYAAGNAPAPGPLLPREERKLWAAWPAVAHATSHADLAQAYVGHVMVPLLGSEIIDPGLPVSLSPSFLEAVATRAAAKRPLSRAAAGPLKFSGDRALLIGDHSLFSTRASSAGQDGFKCPGAAAALQGLRRPQWSRPSSAWS